MIRESNYIEQRIAKVVVFMASAWAIVVALCGSIVDDIPSWAASPRLRVGIKVAIAIVSFAVLYLGKEWLIQRALIALRPSKVEKMVFGPWTINISYSDPSSGGRISRSGIVQFNHSVAGLLLRGGKLLDSKSHDVVVEQWVSVFAEIVPNLEGEVLLYAYKIKRGDDQGFYDKVGYVVAKRRDSTEPFKGMFADLAVTASSKDHIRQGDVALLKNS